MKTAVALSYSHTHTHTHTHTHSHTHSHHIRMPLSGRKKWILFPPSVRPPGVHAGGDVDASSVIDWFIRYYVQIADHPMRNDMAARDRPWECVVRNRASQFTKKIIIKRYPPFPLCLAHSFWGDIN